MMDDNHSHHDSQADPIDHEGSASPSGRFIGIVSLDTQFPRLLGDIGNPASFGYPVRYQVVAGADPDKVVRQRAEGLLPPFLEAAEKLVDQGAAAITTTCGFLTLFQADLTRKLQVPVATSALLQWRNLNARMRKKRVVGILTIDADALTPTHLAAAHVPSDPTLCPIQGMPKDGHFVQCILGNQPTLDRKLAEQEIVAAARKLVADHPNVGAILLECTNMPPYAEAIREATGLPVSHALTMVDALAQACGLQKHTRH